MLLRAITFAFLMLFFLNLSCFNLIAQESTQSDTSFQKRKVILPIWTYQDPNREIYGVSFGIRSRAKHFNTRTNGFRVEAIGIGILLSMMPEFPVNNDSTHVQIMEQPPSQIVNGMNLSPLGSMCFCDVNGVSLGGWGQWMRSVNGFSASLFIHLTEQHNGVSFGAWNVNTQTRGI